MKTTCRYPVGKVLKTPVEIDVSSFSAHQTETPQNAFHFAMLLALGVPQEKVNDKLEEKPLPNFSLNN